MDLKERQENQRRIDEDMKRDTERSNKARELREKEIMLKAALVTKELKEKEE